MAHGNAAGAAVAALAAVACWLPAVLCYFFDFKFGRWQYSNSAEAVLYLFRFAALYLFRFAAAFRMLRVE